MTHLNKTPSYSTDYVSPINIALELTRKTKLIALDILYHELINWYDSNSIDPQKRVYKKSLYWEIVNGAIKILE